MNRSLRILYLDDNPLDRDLVRRALNKAGGFEVVEASARAEFEARLAEGEYDVILTDFHVPGFGGLEALDAARATDPRRPVVVVTGTGSEETAIEAMKRGAADYVIKTAAHIRQLPVAIQAALEKKRLQVEREAAEAKYRLLVEQLPAITYIVEFGEANRTTYISPQVETILGFSPEAWLADRQLWLRQLHPEDRERVLAEVRRDDADRRPLDVEYRVLARDGRVVWIRNTASVAQVGAGGPAFSLGIMTDVTEHKQAGELLRRQSARAQMLAEFSLLLARGSLDLQIILDISIRRLGELVGDTGSIILTAEDEQTLTLAAVYHPDPETVSFTRDFLSALPLRVGEGATGRVVQTGEPLLIPVISTEQIRPQVRPELWPALDRFAVHSLIAAPLRAQGRVIGAISLWRLQPGRPYTAADQVFLQDLADRIAQAIENARLFQQVQTELAERKRAEEALRASQQFLSTVMNSLAAVVFTVKMPERRIEHVNPAVRSVFGYEPEEVIGKTTREFYPDEAVFLKFGTAMQAALAAGQDLFRHEQRLARKDGSRLWSDTHTTVVRTNGEITHVVSVIHDITERKQAEESLRRRAEEMTALYETSLDLTAPHALPALLQTIVKRAARLLNAPSGGLYLCDPARRAVRCVVSYNTPRDFTGATLNYGEGVGGLIAQRAEPLIVDDYRTWPGRAAVYGDDQPFVSVVGAPMLWQGQVSGVIVIDDWQPQRFTQADVQLLTLFANHAAVAVENARLLEQTQQRLQELTAIYDAARRLQQLYTPETLAQEIIHVLEQILHYENGAVLLVDLATRRLMPLALTDQGRGPEFVAADKAYVESRDVRVGQGLTGWVAQTGQSVRLGDVRQDPRYLAVRDDIRSELCVPLRVGDRLIGVVNVETTRPDAYAESDQRLLETIAAQISVAVQNAQLLEAERRARHMAETLSAANQALIQTLDLDLRLNVLLEHLAQLVPYDSANVMLLEGESRFVVRAHRGYERFGDPALIGSTAFDAQANPLVRPLLHGQSVLVADSRQTPGWEVRPGGEHVRSWLGVPLVAAGQVIGHYSVDKAEPNFFTPEHLRLAKALAAQGAMAIQNARLYKTEREQRARAEALARTSARLNAQLDLVDVLHALCEETARALNVPLANVSLYDERREVLEFASGVGLPPDLKEHSRPVPRALYEQYVRQSPLLAVVPDLQAAPNLPNADLYAFLNARTAVSVGMVHKEQFVGVLAVATIGETRQFSQDELVLLISLADPATLAIVNARLFEQVRAGRTRLQDLSRQLLETQEAERRRLARELHDEIGQLLTGLKLALDLGAAAGLSEAQALVADLIAKVRTLSLDLRPAMLDDLGLLPALKWLFDRYTAQTQIRVNFKHTGIESRRFPPEVETALYRLAQEALTNVARHAGVREAAVRVWATPEALGVQIEDRGARLRPGGRAGRPDHRRAAGDARARRAAGR